MGLKTYLCEDCGCDFEEPEDKIDQEEIDELKRQGALDVKVTRLCDPCEDALKNTNPN